MTIRSKGPQSEAKPFNVSSSSNSAVPCRDLVCQKSIYFLLKPKCRLKTKN